METHFDWMADIKAVQPSASVFSGEAPQERREETVSSDADRVASMRGVLPSLVSGCKDDDYDHYRHYFICFLTFLG